MSSLTPAALGFVAHLMRAHDGATFHRAFEVGLVPLFRHHSIIASSHVDRVGFMSMWTSERVPRQSPEWWARHDALHPAFPYLRERPGLAVCTMSDVLDAHALDQHPYYREVMEPAGWRHGLALMVWSGKRLAGVVAISRTRAQGDFSARERQQAELLQPLLAAAWERIAAHSREQDHLLAQELLLSMLPLAALVYSADTGRVLYYNRAAVDAVAHWRGEAARNRPRALTRQWLPSEIVDACADVPKRGCEIACPRGGLRATLRRIDPRAHFESNVVLVVLDADGPSNPSASARWLQVARGLSRAEQAVAHEAARGLSNAAIGRLLGKSVPTVKKQLESVFAKAQLTSRAQLGALYHGLAPSRRAPDDRD